LHRSAARHGNQYHTTSKSTSEATVTYTFLPDPGDEARQPCLIRCLQSRA
jgi:hypothetical protein